jgi:tetratricopeptide (TPR) repeat protein
MRWFLFTVVWFCCMLQSMAADNQNVTRLQRELKSVSNEDEKIRILLDLSEKLEADSAQMALHFAITAKELAEKSNNQVFIAFSLVKAGNALLALNEFEESKINYEKALELLRQLISQEPNRNDINLYLAQAYYGLGYADYFLGYFEKSVIYYQDALRKYTALDNTQKVANIYQNMGLVHYDLKNFDLSLEYYFKSLDLNKTLGNKKNIAGLTQNIGLFYFNNADYQKASSYIN